MSNVQTNLSERMRALAQTRTDLPIDWMQAATDFDEATAGYFSDPPTVSVKRFLGCFARARRMWCTATGESLI